MDWTDVWVKKTIGTSEMSWNNVMMTPISNQPRDENCVDRSGGKVAE